MLEIKKVSKVFKKGNAAFTALNDVSLQVLKGDFIAVVGESGSGKSTLLHTIGGLIEPNSGSVCYYGKSIYEMKPNEMDNFRKRNIGFVFQQFHLIPYLTVSENILAVCNSVEEKGQLNVLLDRCALMPLKNKYPSELSVGEKQRVSFIRAVISTPDILLADEPTGNLDLENSRILMGMVSDFHKGGGTVFLVSHDPQSISYASKQLRLHAGSICS